jgi:hypothetical protein
VADDPVVYDLNDPAPKAGANQKRPKKKQNKAVVLAIQISAGVILFLIICLAGYFTWQHFSNASKTPTEASFSQSKGASPNPVQHTPASQPSASYGGGAGQPVFHQPILPARNTEQPSGNAGAP